MEVNRALTVAMNVERTSEGDHFWAEVVQDDYDHPLDEKVYFSTGFCDTEAEARTEAEAWIKANG